uniref:Sodium channel and clathrin linker 1 n=1 Tax=Malurus cyaneus samueli TaxID=2593467 RepID=A0A8C5T5C8_9PASS
MSAYTCMSLCQAQMSEMKLKLEEVIKENERLHAELKEPLEKQLEALPFMHLETDIPADDNIVRALQEQLRLAKQEKDQAVELWQTLLQEHDRLQQQYQERLTESQIHVAEKKRQNTNQQFLQTVTEQNVELEELRKKLRYKPGSFEKMFYIFSIEEDRISAQERETASDKRLQQMQSSIKQLEIRLCMTAQESERLKAERAVLEEQISELQAKSATLESEKYEAVAKVQDCIQLLEEATLEKNQALFEEKQKEEEIKKLKDEMSQLAEDTAARIRKEVSYHVCKEWENVLVFLRLAHCTFCGDAMRSKLTYKFTLQIYREYREHESDSRKLEQLHQKYLLAESAKEGLQLSLQMTQNKLKQLKMNSDEEKSRCQEVINKLQSTLDSERQKSTFVSEQRLKLQQENEQLEKEMEGLRKLAIEVQQKAKIKISTMEHEHAVKENGYEAQLKEMEDTSLKSTAELRRLLVAQQKATNRWKEETKNLTETAEARINKLKSELRQQKLRSQELISQLETANGKVTEDETLITEYREYIDRLQKRLSQAEQRAATALQQAYVTFQGNKLMASVPLEEEVLLFLKALVISCSSPDSL